METTNKKLAMLAMTLSVLFVGMSGCGAQEDVLYSGETTVLTEEAATEAAAAESAPPDTAEPVADADTSAQEIYVHVCGAVCSPGVYTLAGGARICDAIEAAGGCNAQASADSLNLAQTVSDGMRVYVPTVQEAAEASSTESTGTVSQTGSGQWVSGADADTDAAAQTDSASASLVNLNTATKEELMTLPGIGEAKAESILAYREEHGAFTSIEEIMEISGIKESVFSKIKDKIGV